VNKHLADVSSLTLHQLRRLLRHGLYKDAHPCSCYVDYCNAVLASSPRYIIDKLQRVLNAAARLVSGTVVSHPDYTTTCPGLMLLSVFDTTVASQCTGVYKTTRPGRIWSNAAHKLHTLPVHVVSNQLFDIVSLCHVTGSVPPVVGP